MEQAIAAAIASLPRVLQGKKALKQIARRTAAEAIAQLGEDAAYWNMLTVAMEALRYIPERNAWLDDKLAGKSSDVDLERTGKIGYNTIQDWRNGKITTRRQYVRRRIADALNALGISCDFSKVPG